MPQHRALTPTQATALVYDVRVVGLSHRKAAEKYGIHVNTVARTLKRAFEEPKPRRVKVPGPRAKLQPHGTSAAYQRHRENKQPTCAKCRAAKAAESRAYRKRRKARLRKSVAPA